MNVFDYVLLFVISITVLTFFAVFPLVTIYCRRNKQIKRKVVNQKPIEGIKVETKKKNKRLYLSDFMIGLTRYLCIQVGKFPSFKVRNFLYRKVFCMDISRETIIYGGCEFRDPWNISIGKSVIGPNNILDGRAGIEIKDNVCTASNVNIWTMQHDAQSPSFGISSGKVIVEDYAWISSRVTVLPGRLVGKGAVVACGAVVTKTCEEYGIYCGIPAARKAERNKALDYKLDQHWWFI